jgi:predicted membrane channel-forming protein YqfA (hemolysin III family)
LLLSIVGAIVLIARVVEPGDAWRITGCAIFAVALIAVYAASTLSHGVAEPWLRRVEVLPTIFSPWAA